MATRKDGSHFDARTKPHNALARVKKSGSQRQTEYRLRLASKGRTEVRGVYAHADDHASIRAFAHALQKARQTTEDTNTHQLTFPI